MAVSAFLSQTMTGLAEDVRESDAYAIDEPIPGHDPAITRDRQMDNRAILRRGPAAPAGTGNAERGNGGMRAN
ncbi:hypothetical protein GCM10022224_102360 [Nonomuraea antimicrobica]|uniref:Uncharacterized protein n=1 Tax=Nonomuraea antimicrobica TaxID=561173 RepID=A0ABP7EPE2_9ACTN